MNADQIPAGWQARAAYGEHGGCQIFLQEQEGTKQVDWTVVSPHTSLATRGTAKDAENAIAKAKAVAGVLDILGDLGVWDLDKLSPKDADAINMVHQSVCLVCGGNYADPCMHTAEEIRAAFALVLRIPRAGQ